MTAPGSGSSRGDSARTATSTVLSFVCEARPLLGRTRSTQQKIKKTLGARW